MARTKRSLKLTPTERKRLLGALRQQGEGGVALRAAIVLWSAQGQSAASIAQALGVTPRTVYGWRQRWRALRLEGLADAPRSGRPARVDADYLALLVRTAQADPHQLGFAFARWTCARLAAYLQQRTGLQVSAYWVGELLRCHGFVWRRTQLTTRNLPDEAEKSARRSAPPPFAEAGPPSGSRLRAMVRGRRTLRPVAGDALHVEEAGQPPDSAHSRHQRPSGRGGRHPLPQPALALHPPATHRHRSTRPALAEPVGGTRQAHRQANRAHHRQRTPLFGSARPDSS